MKVTSNNNFYFFLISCLVHSLILWGLDARTVMTREQRIVPAIRFVFGEAAPHISPARPPVPQEKVVSPPQPKKIIKHLPREEAPPGVVSTPVLRPENKSQVGLVEEKAPSTALALTAPAGEQIIPASVHKIGNTEPTVSRQNILDGYLAIIRTILERNKVYTLWARRNNWEGTVQLRFIVLRDGIVEDTRVIGSSGFSVLDQSG